MRRAIQSFITTGILVLPLGSAFGQQAGESASFPWEGEVTGANVYVRSGAGNNWYPTAKMNTGDRVLVLGEKFGWYQVAPPAGSVSYIDISAVDRKAGAKTGTVKQDKVYVRAGSKLEPQRKSSTQLVLNKGATVDIIGEADGFYQIMPPQGAALFMSKQYIKPVSAHLRTGLIEKHVMAKDPAPPAPAPGPISAVTPDLQKASAQSPPPQPGDQARITLPAETDHVAAAESAAPPEISEAKPDESMSDESATPMKEPSPKPATAKKHEPAPAPPAVTGRYKAMLTAVEGELAAVMRRPFDDQDFAALAEKYGPIANQTEESIPAQVARIRIRQLNDRAQLKLARSEIVKDTRDIEDLRANMDKKRIEIMNRPIEQAMKRWELEGELRRSFAFAPENRRYRLVDPKSQVTIAYVDIPTTVEANPEHLIGQFVGIDVSGKKFSPSARVPIAVAKELVDLSPRKNSQAPVLTPAHSARDNNPDRDNNTRQDDADAGKVYSAEPADLGSKTEP